MTFPDYWRRLIERDPRLLKHDAVKMTIPSFRRELEKAFDAAKAGAGEPSVFERIFGKPFWKE